VITGYNLEIMMCFPGNPSGIIQFEAQAKRIRDRRKLNWITVYVILATWHHVAIEVQAGRISRQVFDE